MLANVSHLETVINLSLESYFNRGLSSERCHEIINNTEDPTSSCRFKFHTGRTGINGNPSVKVMTRNLDHIDMVVEVIDCALMRELNKIEQVTRNGKSKSK